MKQYLINAFKTESASQLRTIRQAELKKQHWNRAKSQLLANNEDMILSDAHWDILKHLRRSYMKTGLPRHARYLSESLDQKFSAEGGKKYLRNLFPGGVITQGSRFANLPTPSDAVDISHGSCY
ncbi:MAG: TusE/DsrC/DsvC family sulfur relay protein [Gammaproteobacteria bacterium]